MPPKGKAYQTDWLCSATSNVHIANHKGWFTTFTAFTGPLDSIHLGPSSGGGEVHGIGDVELEVTKALDQGRIFTKKIILHDVLYVPTFIANIFGQLAGTGYRTGGLKFRKVVERTTGKSVGKIDEKAVLPRLWLKKQQVGRSSLDPNMRYCINAWWSEEERARWSAHRLTCQSTYTPEEKAWLKKNFRGEYRFLRGQRLSIYKDVDREEGRKIVRQMMADDVDREAGGE